MTAAPKNNILLHGSYFGYNFGDTLLCALFNRWIRVALNEQKKEHIKIVTPLANNQNQKAIKADLRGISGIGNTATAIFCGGGYFGEPNPVSWWWPKRNHLRHMMLASLLQKKKIPVHIMGVGAGPITNDNLRANIIKLFEYSDTTIVRDNETAEFLRNSGYSDKLDISTDAALSLHGTDIVADSEQRIANLFFGNTAGKKIIVLHLTEFGNESNDKVLNIIREKILNIPAYNDDVRIIAITDSSPRKFGLLPQQKSARKIVQNLSNDSGNVLLWEYNRMPWDLVALLNQASLVITNKLHVGIVATALRKFVISLPYHQKTPRFYRQLGMEERCLPLHEYFDEKAFGALLDEWLAGNEYDWSKVDELINNMPYRKKINEIVGGI